MIYIVQAGDTPMRIAKKLSGGAARVGELVRMNPHKRLVGVGASATFAKLETGEALRIPPRWGKQGFGHVPHFEVAPSAIDGEPILTVSGKPSCCAECAKTGGSCGKKGVGQLIRDYAPGKCPTCPGSTSMPVGFGQDSSQTTAPSVAASALAGWGVPIAVGLVSLAAGFGLAYVITQR